MDPGVGAWGSASAPCSTSSTAHRHRTAIARTRSCVASTALRDRLRRQPDVEAAVLLISTVAVMAMVTLRTGVRSRTAPSSPNKAVLIAVRDWSFALVPASRLNAFFLGWLMLRSSSCPAPSRPASSAPCSALGRRHTSRHRGCRWRRHGIAVAPIFIWGCRWAMDDVQGFHKEAPR
jgi:hypothetical protein